MFEADITAVMFFEMLNLLKHPCLDDLSREPEHEIEGDACEQLGHTITSPSFQDDKGEDDDVESMGQCNDSGMGLETSRHAVS